MQWSWHPVQLSIFVASTAAVIAFIFAIMAAYLMTTKEKKGRLFLETIFFLPLVLPPSVIGFLLIIIFGNQSFVGKMIEKWTGVNLIFSVTAAVIAAGVVAFPLMYQSIKSGFLSVDKNVLEAARVDGASKWQQLYSIILPLSSRSLLTGMILGFTRAFGEFGATLMFAGNIPGKTQTLPTAIYFAIESGQTEIAWYYCIISISFSFILLLGANHVKVHV